MSLLLASTGWAPIKGISISYKVPSIWTDPLMWLSIAFVVLLALAAIDFMLPSKPEQWWRAQPSDAGIPM